MRVRELVVEQAIAICDGDVRAALKSALAHLVPAIEVDDTHAVSFSFKRGKVSPARQASEKVEERREILLGGVVRNRTTPLPSDVIPL
jgi:hypothetical protein